jgi:hypothetical protein
MKEFLESTYTVENFTNEILRPTMATFVALYEGKIVGYAQIREIEPEPCIKGPSSISYFIF